ncbi:MAG TPA: hypothetical protein VHG93_21695 [Longimicrobium sp.]|nr:hypothetical protein [Longimicrobium sp.]
MRKPFWWAVAAYLVPTFPLGYAWHLVTFGERYERLGMYREEVIIPLGLLSMAIQAVVFAWAYPRLFSTRREEWMRSAAAFGGTFALLAWSFTTLPVAAKYRMSSVADFMMLETAFTLVQFLLVSPLIALAYRQPAHASAPAPSHAHAVRSAAG